MQHPTDFDREWSFAHGPWTEEDCVGRMLLQPRSEHSDVASVISSVVAFRCSAHRSISRLVHELGCGDLPSNSFCVGEPVASLFWSPQASRIASADARSE